MTSTNTTTEDLRHNSKRHRVQLNFTEASFEDLQKLQKKMNLSRQDLFRYALRWLQWTYEELLQGGEIQIKESNGQVKRVVAPFLPR